MTQQARNKDLWGDIPEVRELTPRDMMREQAAYLEQKTKGLVTAEIVIESEPVKKGTPNQTQTFYLVAPTMNYWYELFSIYQKDVVKVYPVIFNFDDNIHVEAHDETEFTDYLQKTLGSERTKRIVGSLLAQAKSA
jgi:hypothetical protein